MLIQYLLYNNKTLFGIKHTLYRFEKTKIAFENHHLINVKLFSSILNYTKFYTIIYFI